MERAVPILPADDLAAARAFYVDGLGFRVTWEASADGHTGLMGVARGTMVITLDAPMSGHGRDACVSLIVDDADACYEDWRHKVAIPSPPRDEEWGARTFVMLDPSGNSVFVIGPAKTGASNQALMPQRSSESLQEQFGGIDIYLFDQLQRGRIAPGMRVLDAGCGGGRNLVYLLRQGYDVAATDQDAQAIAAVRTLAASIAPQIPESQFRVEPVDACSFDDASFDVVVSSAVLHFARDEAHFDRMVGEMWRVLRSGGPLFCRLASTIGLVGARSLGNGRYRLPDGSERYLVSADQLLEVTRRLGGRLLDPLKTTVVQDERSMTTWVIRK
jgi:SAM-dependent methyltransferase